MSTLQIELPSEIVPSDALLLLAIKLLETERLTLGQAAKLAGYSKGTFMELLGKHGSAVFAYPPDELDREMDL